MEHENEKLENLIERFMRDEVLESPSSDFTSNVMDKVYELESSTTTVYQPLISKRAWVIISVLFISLVTYVLLNGTGTERQWFSDLDLSKYQFNVFQQLDFQFSKTLSYGAIFLAIMLGIQVTVLKSYFDKRISY